MPVLSISTNIFLEQENTLSELSTLVSKMLGKPENYVMIHLNDQQKLLFAGSDEAAALCSLTNLGMTGKHAADYSKVICNYLETNLNIPADRVYIEFKSPERSLFGWNNGTF